MNRYEGKRIKNKMQDLGDPFQTRTATTTKKSSQSSASLRRRFNQWFSELSQLGRIVTLVAIGLVAILTVGVVALKSWMRPPELLPVEQQTPIGSEEMTQPQDGELVQPTLSGERKEQFYTFLLVGTDKDDGNTDTIMVVSYDTINQKISVMSIPRDTMINAGWDVKKINSVYSRGLGMEGLSKEVAKLIGFQPDYYIKIQLDMFVELVDLVGGVEFDVPRDMDYDDPYQDLHIHLTKGTQLLDGDKAMQLVRFRRYAEGDIQRMAVQQDFMKALISQCLSFKNWTKVSSYIELALRSVTTNLEYSSVAWLAANVLGFNSAPALDLGNIYTCTMPANYYASAYSRLLKTDGISYVIPYPNEIADVVNLYFNPYLENVTVTMLDTMTILENGDIASSTGILKDTQHNAIMAERRLAQKLEEQGTETGEEIGEITEPIEGEVPTEETLPVETVPIEETETPGETGDVSGETTEPELPEESQPIEDAQSPVETPTNEIP